MRDLGSLHGGGCADDSARVPKLRANLVGAHACPVAPLAWLVWESGKAPVAESNPIGNLARAQYAFEGVANRIDPSASSPAPSLVCQSLHGAAPSGQRPRIISTSGCQPNTAHWKCLPSSVVGILPYTSIPNVNLSKHTGTRAMTGPFRASSTPSQSKFEIATA